MLRNATETRSVRKQREEVTRQGAGWSGMYDQDMIGVSLLISWSIDLCAVHSFFSSSYSLNEFIFPVSIIPRMTLSHMKVRTCISHASDFSRLLLLHLK